MTEEAFESVVDSQLEKIESLLLVKGKEYARQDVLSNFKRGASISNETPEKCLLGYWKKHLVSIMNMIEDLDKNDDSPINLSKWDEKLIDSHNYQILLRALIQERYEEQLGVTNVRETTK